MNTKPKRQPTFTTEVDGGEVVVVPLANGQSAMLDRADWDDLRARGLSPNWTYNDNGEGLGYVRCAGGENLVIVARVILGAGKAAAVRYRNGDRTNLRRRNLYVTGGGRAKGKPSI